MANPVLSSSVMEYSHFQAPTPDNHVLSSEGLPQGWTMQLMRNGRTLFIDNANQVNMPLVRIRPNHHCKTTCFGPCVGHHLVGPSHWETGGDQGGAGRK
jgi:hypothetical protein